MEWRKFYLVPGQQAPKDSTGRGLADGGIAWYGDPTTFPENITWTAMTQKEIDAPAIETSLKAAKIKAITDNLPSWQQVSDKIDAAFPDPAQSTAVKKLARLLYLELKGSET